MCILRNFILKLKGKGKFNSEELQLGKLQADSFCDIYVCIHCGLFVYWVLFFLFAARRGFSDRYQVLNPEVSSLLNSFSVSV